MDAVGDWFTIARDDPDTPDDEGVTFVHHNGLGGKSIRDQERCLPTEPPCGCNGEWAAIYAEQQAATFGALFEAWGTDSSGPPDFDSDGDVDVKDFLDLVARWGPCP
jgi:hypothetical protein